jgi:hypothetical protein
VLIVSWNLNRATWSHRRRIHTADEHREQAWTQLRELGADIALVQEATPTRRPGPPANGNAARPAQDLEALRPGRPLVHKVGRLLPGPRRHVLPPATRPGRRGSSPTPTTRSARGSTSSRTSSARSPTSLSRRRRSACRSARSTTSPTRDGLCPATSRRRSDDRPGKPPPPAMQGKKVVSRAQEPRDQRE